MKPKNTGLGLCNTIGLVTAVTVIIFVATNGLVSYASAQKQFVADLSGKNEVPPVDSTASGIAKFQLSGDGQTLDYQINVTNINAVMGAHIHSGKQSQNGPVIAGLFNPNMSSPPTGKVNGSLAKGSIKSSDLQGPLKGHPLSDLVHLISGHGAYVNIHTQPHQNGEIRGQIG